MTIQDEVAKARSLALAADTPIEELIRYNCPQLSQRPEFQMARQLILRARQMLLDDLDDIAASQA